ncbi:MAG: energy transducer TonB [Sphingomicrobium sp.]
MRKLIAFVLAVAVVSTANAKTRDVRRLAASTRSVVDYAKDSCSLGRSFGDGDRKVTVFFDQYAPGDTFTLTFVGSSVDSNGLAQDATVKFGPNEEEDDVTVVGATTDNTPAIILQGSQRIAPLTKTEEAARKKAADDGGLFEPAPIGPQRERAATWLKLGKIRSFDFLFETGPMDAPLAALRECSWDMVKSWGLDVEQQKHLSRKAYPTEPSYRWFSDADYPAAMIRGGYQGIVNFRILVDETGKPTSCQIQVSTRPKEFDDVVCRVAMKRARFHSPLDSEGKPVRSYWRQTVNFRLEP